MGIRNNKPEKAELTLHFMNKNTLEYNDQRLSLLRPFTPPGA